MSLFTVSSGDGGRWLSGFDEEAECDEGEDSEEWTSEGDLPHWIQVSV